MSNLIKVSDIGLPHISGTVSVPLAELDKMRADHAAAIRLAKDLEDKQAQVRVVYFEESWTVAEYDRYGHPRREKRLVENKVEYKNFEDFREKIAEEERERVQTKLSGQQDQITSDQNKLATLSKKLSELTSENSNLKEDLRERGATVADLQNEKASLEERLESFKLQNENLNTSVITLRRELHDLKRKKSLWYRITTVKL